MKNFLTFIATAFLLAILASCHDENEPLMPEEVPDDMDAKRTVLIYAVASNSLSSQLVNDKAEMLEAAPIIAGLGKDVRVLLYSVDATNATEAQLSELKLNQEGKGEFFTISTYDRNTFSTDPERMRRVFSDVRDLRYSDSYGLILWSHGSGWIPEFYNHEVPGLQKSFGIDTYQHTTDKCDIIELADAIPDDMFDYVWFDVCYMMGIEVAYQLRNKFQIIVGCPTEDPAPGMNYASSLPILASPQPNFKEAAEDFFDYYSSVGMAVSISVVSTEGLDSLAHATSEIYAKGIRPMYAFGLQDYGRSPYRGLYDFGQFTRAYLADNGNAGQSDASLSESDRSQLLAELDAALNNVLVYAKCTRKDFNGNANAFDPEIFSGMSCHFPNMSSSQIEDYYRTLDWTLATNP